MKYRRILLVNPPKVDQGGYKPSPLGLLYLAAYLQKHCPQAQVRVTDGAIQGKEAVLQTCRSFRPDLIGISILTPGRHQGLHIATEIKRLLPRSKTIFGNVHATIMWKQLMSQYKQVDYIARGEGEQTLYELVVGKPTSSIKGLVWRSRKKILKNIDRPMIVDLNKLPFPAWDLVDPLMYPARGEGLINDIDLAKEVRFPVIFSRGCMGACTFCSSWMIWKGYRYRNGKLVADEIEMLCKRYNAKHFVFQDDTLTGNQKEIISFCKEIIKRKLKVAIYGTTRVDKVNLKMLNYMKKAGFYELSFGIESGSPAMLLKINKRTDIQLIKKAVDLTRKAHIKVNALMMYGLPRETNEDRILSKKLIKNINPDEVGTVGAVWIFPGTALYEQAKQAKLLDDSFWLGPKPYYIYRGGIGEDKIDRKQQIVDEIHLYFSHTRAYKMWHYVTSHALRTLHKLQN